jgi:hypothetical protein
LNYFKMLNKTKLLLSAETKKKQRQSNPNGFLL